MNKCAECNSNIPIIGINGKPKRFCNIRCNARFHSREKYLNIKDSEIYKKSRKKYMKKWVIENRDKFNKMMREYYRKKYDIKPENYRV